MPLKIDFAQFCPVLRSFADCCFLGIGHQIGHHGAFFGEPESEKLL